MAVDGLCGAVCFFSVLWNCAKGSMTQYSPEVNSLFFLVTLDGNTVVNDASSLPLGLVHASFRIPLYQAFSLGRFSLLLLVSF